MKKIALMAAAASLVVAAACSQQDDTIAENDTTAPAPYATNEGATMPMGAQSNTQDFASTVAMNDMLEIQASEVAQTKAANADVKAFARDMIQAHTQTTNELKTWAQSTSTVLPTALGQDRVALVNNLQTADAEGFDDRYLDTVIDAHETAISAFESYAQGGEDAQLRQWAQTTLPTLRTHLERANTLREAVNRS